MVDINSLYITMNDNMYQLLYFLKYNSDNTIDLLEISYFSIRDLITSIK